MVVRAGFPYLRTGIGFQRIDISLEIAEINRAVSKHGRNSHTAGGGKRPVHATSTCIERIDTAVVRSDVKPAVNNAWNTEAGHDAWKSKGPFNFQLRRCLAGQARGCGRLEACITSIGPTVPVARRSLRRAGALRIGDASR